MLASVGDSGALLQSAAPTVPLDTAIALCGKLLPSLCGISNSLAKPVSGAPVVRVTLLALGFLVLGLVLQSCGRRTCPQPDRAIKTALLKRSLSYIEENVRSGGVAPTAESIRIGLHDPSMYPPAPTSLFGKQVVFTDASGSPPDKLRNSEDLMIDFTYSDEYCLATLSFGGSPTAVLKALPPEDWQLALLDFTYKDGVWELAGPQMIIFDYLPPE